MVTQVSDSSISWENTRLHPNTFGQNNLCSVLQYVPFDIQEEVFNGSPLYQYTAPAECAEVKAYLENPQPKSEWVLQYIDLYLPYLRCHKLPDKKTTLNAIQALAQNNNPAKVRLAEQLWKLSGQRLSTEVEVAEKFSWYTALATPLEMTKLDALEQAFATLFAHTNLEDDLRDTDENTHENIKKQGDFLLKNGSIIEGLDIKTHFSLIRALNHSRGVSSFGLLQQRIAEFACNKEVVLAAVRQNGYALVFASEALRNDKEVVLAAVRQNGYALQCASEALRNDKEVVLAAVRQDGYALGFASEALRNDKEVVLAAVRQNGYALQCASEALRNDKEVVLAAVRQNGRALQYASGELRNDKEVVLAAVRQNGYALGCASEALRNDKEVVLAAVRQNGLVLVYASKALQGDEEVIRAANGEKQLASHVSQLRIE